MKKCVDIFVYKISMLKERSIFPQGELPVSLCPVLNGKILGGI